MTTRRVTAEHREDFVSEQPWIDAYPPGARWDAPLERVAVPELLANSAKEFPDKPALEFMGRRITYAELDRLVDRAAKGLQAIGVKPGVHVGLFLPNSPHYPIAFFGVLRAGGVVVNYSPLDAEKALEHKVKDSETDILITLDLAALYPQMSGLLEKTRVTRLVIGDLAEFSGHPQGVRAHLAGAKQLAEVIADPRHVAFAALLDNDGAYEAHPIEPEETLAVLQYTGGTTGLPKGAMLTHANLTAAVSQSLQGARATLIPGEERVLGVLPPFHIYSLTVVMLLGVRLAAEVVQHVRFDPETAIKDIAAKKINLFPGVPTMFIAVLHHPAAKGADLSSLKSCTSGGAPLPVEVQNAFQSFTGCRLAEGWGMTETAAIGTFTPVPGRQKVGSCGIPQPGIDFKFLSVDDGVTYVARGERGEICLKGDNVMRGYWKNPAATAAVTTADGYMRTGDVGYMDEDGYIYIVDRTKDMILTSGFNVYPRNIEEAIYQHPAVEAVSVIGIPDEYRGQTAKAFLKLKPGAAAMTLEEMKTFLKDRLGKHEMISAMEVRPELPRTLVGKLSKKELYDEEAKKRAGA
jgi:long-chain acyl-CoA synthetase